LWSDETVTHIFFVLLLIAYLIVGALFAALTPDWQAPDEPAHYNYIRQVAENGDFPVIEVGDWQQTYQNELTSARFNPELLDRLDTIQYEDHQPPLYYLIAAPIFSATNGNLTALRLLSVLFGAGVLWCAYRIALVMLSDRPGVALAAATFVAFLTQHMAMLSAVNNDGLAELLIGLTLLATIHYIKSSSVGAGLRPALMKIPLPLLLGLLVGLIFVTKSTGYFLAGVVPLAIFLRWRNERAWRPTEVPVGRTMPLQHLFTSLALFFTPALILGGLWWLRNFGVYGFPDFLGLRAHDHVVADQLRTAQFIAENGRDAYISRAVSDTFNSFWGQFGWMALPLQNWMYRIFQGLLLVIIGGLVVDRFILARSNVGAHSRAPLQATTKTTHSSAEKSAQLSAWLILWLTLVLAALAFVYYNTVFLQFQGRYLFPGLIPFGLLMALGLDAWRRLLLGKLDWAQWLPFAVYALLIPFDIYLILRVIRPLLLP
jgi:4-amino-4-deoxy-L-arabinose transferase-like glycosyltransferase